MKQSDLGSVLEHREANLPQGSTDNHSYLDRLTRQRLLTFEEETELSARVQKGDAQAKDRLVEANMRLVMNIARTYSYVAIPFEDLIQEGAIGLMMAAERFDPSKGYRFSTYATAWIKQAIGRAIDNTARAIRIPGNVSELLRKVEGTRAMLVREQGEEPTTDQIAARLGISTAQVDALIQSCQEPVSLDMLVGDDDGSSLSSLLADNAAVNPQETVLCRERTTQLAALLSVLTPKEREIMLMGLGFDDVSPCPPKGIGAKLRISRERVKQIEIQALRKLKIAAKRFDFFIQSRP
jgi:RNA polymerase primary sigma factor